MGGSSLGRLGRPLHHLKRKAVEEGNPIAGSLLRSTPLEEADGYQFVRGFARFRHTALPQAGERIWILLSLLASTGFEAWPETEVCG